MSCEGFLLFYMYCCWRRSWKCQNQSEIRTAILDFYSLQKDKTLLQDPRGTFVTRHAVILKKLKMWKLYEIRMNRYPTLFVQKSSG